MTNITETLIGLEILQSYCTDPHLYAVSNIIKVRAQIDTLREEDRKLLADKGWYTEGDDLFCHKTK